MASEDMKGTVSTTGMVNNPPPKIQAPDMSKIKMPTAKKQAEPKQVVQKPVEQPQEEGLLSKVENLTNRVTQSFVAIQRMDKEAQEANYQAVKAQSAVEFQKEQLKAMIVEDKINAEPKEEEPKKDTKK